jgi:cytochrome c oxidase subunit IV
MANYSETATTTAHAPNNSKVIWRTLLILSVITCVELIVGMFWAPGAIKANPGMKLWFNIFYLIMTLAKAYFIVAEFMHLGHEVKNLIMTIVLPLFLFVWFIIAFLWEGSSYKNLRDNYNHKVPVLMEQHTTPATPATKGKGAEHSGGEHH